MFCKLKKCGLFDKGDNKNPVRQFFKLFLCHLGIAAGDDYITVPGCEKTYHAPRLLLGLSGHGTCIDDIKLST